MNTPSASHQATELAGKRKRLHAFLLEHKLDAFLITRHEDIAWATAGVVDVRIGLPRETGAASLLFTRDGESYYLTTNNEAYRLAREEFAELDYRPLTQPWYANDSAASIRSVVKGGRVACDDGAGGLPVLSMKDLRLPLSEGEMERYRWLGRNVADAVTEVLNELRPGITEAAMQALLAARLLQQNILPSVLLTATDDRIRSYRHAVPRGGVLQHLGMLNLCARRWGLCISITRFVHFGPLPSEMELRFAAVEKVNAALLHATRKGATADALFATARDAYAAEGYPGEELLHHQGGATGYWEREWLARPGGSERVLDSQAFAWNPSLQGAKVEDTVLLQNGRIEVLTETPLLPTCETAIDEVRYRSSGVLLR